MVIARKLGAANSCKREINFPPRNRRREELPDPRNRRPATVLRLHLQAIRQHLLLDRLVQTCPRSLSTISMGHQCRWIQPHASSTRPCYRAGTRRSPRPLRGSRSVCDQGRKPRAQSAHPLEVRFGWYRNWPRLCVIWVILALSFMSGRRIRPEHLVIQLPPAALLHVEVRVHLAVHHGAWRRGSTGGSFASFGIVLLAIVIPCSPYRSGGTLIVACSACRVSGTIVFAIARKRWRAAAVGISFAVPTHASARNAGSSRPAPSRPPRPCCSGPRPPSNCCCSAASIGLASAAGAVGQQQSKGKERLARRRGLPTVGAVQPYAPASTGGQRLIYPPCSPRKPPEQSPDGAHDRRLLLRRPPDRAASLPAWLEDDHRGRHPALCRRVPPTPTRSTSTPRQRSPRCSVSGSRTVMLSADLISAAARHATAGARVALRRQSLRKRSTWSRSATSAPATATITALNPEKKGATWRLRSLHGRGGRGDRRRGLRPGPASRT